ncbi:hypothetical protein LINPERPRIM_LOCUS14736, partial [Linum perenne]
HLPSPGLHSPALYRFSVIITNQKLLHPSGKLISSATSFCFPSGFFNFHFEAFLCS